MTFDDQSEACLKGIHPDLVSVVRKARETCPFRVTEGMRTLARQKKLLAEKKSRTLNSRHLTGHAIDFVDMAGSYDAAEMAKIWTAIEVEANTLGVALTWGGNWTSFVDRPHVELEWHAYPKNEFIAKAKAIALGVGTGGTAVSVPSIPAGVSNAVSSIEANIALTSRALALAKGVMTFELASMIGVLGLVIAIGCMFLPNGGADAGGSD